MWKDDSLDDLEEEGRPDAEEGQDEDEEYEYEEDYEIEEPHGGGVVLRILLAVFILCVAAAVVLFLLRFLSRPVIQENNTVLDITASDPAVMPEEPEELSENDSSTAIESISAPEPTIEPTPEPTPTPPPFPEQYMIPGVEPGDLTAVRSYIQGQLDAIANDDACPHWDSITVNEDCSVFTVVINSVLETDAEIAAVGKMLEFSKMYAAHAGTTAKEIRIDTMNRLGQLLWSKTPEG